MLQGQEFTEEFLLEYQREDGGEWMRFRNKHGHEVCESYTGAIIVEYRGLFVVNPEKSGKAH